VKKIENKDFFTVLNELAESKSLKKIELTTYNFESITGVVESVKGSDDDLENAFVLLRDEEGVVNDIEIDYIYEILLEE